MALIKCPECGKEISDMAQSCPNCGKPLHINSQEMPSNQQSEQKTTPSNQQSIPLQQKRKNGHGCLITLIIVLLIFGGLGAAISLGVKDVQKNPEKYAKKSVLAKTLELTDEQEAAMLEIFQECGIGEIVEASTLQSDETHTSYYLEDKETKDYSGADYAIVVWIDNETKKIESIFFHDYDIYIDGKAIDLVTNYYVNSDDRDKYRTLSQEIIKSVLNYPDTAEFKGISKWKFGVKEDGSIIVQSIVTAKNAFNVEDTADFQIIFDNYTPISLILDGQEYIQ